MTKFTPLYNNHINLNAKIIDFHGWRLPVEYSGALEEYRNVRSKAGLFDISHMGRIFVSGNQAYDFLQYICTNNLNKLSEGKMLYTTACNAEGKILDDFMIYKLLDKYICVVNASNREKMYKWFCQHKKDYSVSIEDKSDSIVMIAFQGPLASNILFKILDISDLFYLETKEIREKNNIFIVSRSGYTGEDGFEIMVDNNVIVKIWNELLEDKDVSPCGLAVRDILRLEMGYSLYGNDINEDISPIEAGLEWVTDFECKKFIGKEILLNEIYNGANKRMKGFIMLEKGMCRKGYKIFKDSEEIGNVTSGGFSPKLNKFIGMGYVKTDLAGESNTIEINIRNKFYKAKIVPVPFIEPKVKRRLDET